MQEELDKLKKTKDDILEEFDKKAKDNMKLPDY